MDSGITGGILLRSIHKASRVWGCGFSPKVIWGVVKKEKAKVCEIPSLALHDLRRTLCPCLCHQAGELEQIQFLLGHVSAHNRAIPRNTHCGYAPELPLQSAHTHL